MILNFDQVSTLAKPKIWIYFSGLVKVQSYFMTLWYFFTRNSTRYDAHVSLRFFFREHSWILGKRLYGGSAWKRWVNRNMQKSSTLPEILGRQLGDALDPFALPAASLVSMSGRTGMWLKKGKRGQTGLHQGEALLPPPSPWNDSGRCIFKKISCGIETDLDSFFQNSLWKKKVYTEC